MEYVWSCKREPPPELEFVEVGERIRLELHLIRFSLQYFQKGLFFYCFCIFVIFAGN